VKFKERLAGYRQSMEHKHGWGVELDCPACGYRGVPVYRGWSPGYAMGFGNKPTIYAILECPRCARDLEPEASSRLVELFSDVSIPRANRRLLACFFLVSALLVVAAILIFALTRSILGIMPLLFLAPMLALIPVFNRRVAAIRQSCECGSPYYIFMGMLGRAYCFRCSNCGRLLKLRD